MLFRSLIDGISMNKISVDGISINKISVDKISVNKISANYREGGRYRHKHLILVVTARLNSIKMEL